MILLNDKSTGGHHDLENAFELAISKRRCLESDVNGFGRVTRHFQTE